MGTLRSALLASILLCAACVREHAAADAAATASGQGSAKVEEVGTWQRADAPDGEVGTWQRVDVPGGEVGTWYLVDAPAAADGKRPMLEFREGGELGGNAGCNSFGASYTLSDDGRIVIGPVRGTKMYCDEPRMALEARMMGALASTVRLDLSSAKLILRDEGGNALLELERAAPAKD